MVETSGSTGTPKRVVLSRRAVLASVARHRAHGSAARVAGCSPSRRRTSRARRWSAAPSSPASRRCCSRTTRRWRPRSRPAGRRTPPWCRPSCTGCSRTRRTSPRCGRCGRCCSAAARSTRRSARRAADAGVSVVATYGSAETAGGCVYDGVALDGVGLATEADGRLRVSGPMLFDGYDGDPELTARVLVDGWFRTEDAARIDEDGRLQVLGRLDDMVVTGGVNVPAPAVARRLREHPGGPRRRGARRPRRGVGHAAGGVRGRRADAGRGAGLGGRGAPAVVGAAAAGRPSTRCRCWRTARWTGFSWRPRPPRAEPRRSRPRPPPRRGWRPPPHGHRAAAVSGVEDQPGVVGVLVRGRLVEDRDRGAGVQRPGQADPLPLAERGLAGEAVEQVVDARARRPARAPPRRGPRRRARCCRARSACPGAPAAAARTRCGPAARRCPRWAGPSRPGSRPACSCRCRTVRSPRARRRRARSGWSAAAPARRGRGRRRSGTRRVATSSGSLIGRPAWSSRPVSRGDAGRPGRPRPRSRPGWSGTAPAPRPAAAPVRWRR